MKRSITILFTLLLVLVAVSVASAGKFTYLSGIQVQNLAAVDANVQLSYYNQDGTTDGTVDDIIPANDSITYFPVGASDGFDGSVVISADQPVAAISNILGNLGAAAASYVGTSAGSTSVNLPLLFKGNAGFDTWFNVQNTGTAAATVNVAYSDGTLAGPVTIASGAAHTFDQLLETHSAAIFSGVVSSDQPVAVAVIQESVDVMFAYTGFTSGTPNPVLPLINSNNSGYITGVQIQNTGGTPTDVTVSYTAVVGTDCTETLTVPANGSTTFALLAFSGTHAGETCANAPTTFVGSAEVTGNTAGNDLVAIVNQLKVGVNGGTYGSFDAATATGTVVLPLIMDRNSGYYTGFNVQNVGAADTTVTCTFTNSTHTETATLSPGEAMNALQFNAIADAYVGSATCTASASGSIIGVVNELGPSGADDQLLVYEAINN
jgi:hypothetical protein